MPLLLIIYVLALGVRLAYLAAHAGDPLFAYPMVDSAVYLAAAGRWASGGGLPDGALPFGPLYPIVLGALYKITAGNLTVLHALQMAIEATGAPLVFLLGRRLGGGAAGNTATGLLAGVLYALYWPFVYFAGEWLVEPLVIPLLLAGLLFWLRASDERGTNGLIHAGAAGAFLGLSAITRPNGLLVLALVALTTAVMQRKIAHALAVAAAGILIVLPVAGHNYRQSGDWIWVSSTGGINFYIGNNAEATGRDSTFPRMRQWTFEKVEALAEIEAGRPLSPAEVSGHYFAKGRDFVMKSPGAFLALTARKCVQLVSGYEMPNVKDPNFYRARSPFLKWPLFANFGIVLALAVVGVFAGAGQPRGDNQSNRTDHGKRKSAGRFTNARSLTLLFAGFYALSIVIFFVNARYRLPVVPFLLPFSSLGLLAIVQAIRSDRARLVRVGSIFVAVLLLAEWNPLGAVTDESQSWFNVGWAAQKSGRADEALEAYGRVAAGNNWYPLALHNRALIERDAGRTDEALRDLNEAITIDSTYYEAWATLGSVHYRGENYSEAARAYERAAALWPRATYLVNQGLALRNLGAIGPSMAAFDRAISLDPAFVKARAHRAENLIAQGAYDEAAREIETILALEPGNAAAKAQLKAIYSLQEQRNAEKYEPGTNEAEGIRSEGNR